MSLSYGCVQRIVVALGSDDSAKELVASVNTGAGGTSAVLSSDSDATHLGFFGVTAVARAAAITQGYATAARANPAITTTSPSTTLVLTATAIAAKTASLTLIDIDPTSLVTIADTMSQDLKDIGAAYNTLRVELAAAVADLLAVKKLLNALVDDAQGYGLAQ